MVAASVVQLPKVRIQSGFVEGPKLRGLLNRKRGAVALMIEEGKFYEVFADGAVACKAVGNIVGEVSEAKLREYATSFGVPIVVQTIRYLGFNGPDAKKRGLTRQTGLVTYNTDGSSSVTWGMGQFSGKEDGLTNRQS